MQIADDIRNALSPGEQVLWTGQPRQGLLFRQADLFGVPFSLFWCGFSCFWLYSAIGSGAPASLWIFGVPFVLMGAHFVVGRFFVDRAQRARTHYAITPQRVLIASGLMSRTIKSLNLLALAETSLSERAGGSGTIRFGADQPFAATLGDSASWPGAGQHLAPRFDLIDDARQVYEMLRRAQAAAQGGSR